LEIHFNIGKQPKLVAMITVKRTNPNRISRLQSNVDMAFLLLLGLQAHAQYSDNPLRETRWIGVSSGMNTSDNWAWQAMFTYSKRGEGSLVQARAAYTQELWLTGNDSCPEYRNKLMEFGVLWGDGWGGKSWYVTGSVGFGFNVRRYCMRVGYENDEVTGLTLGVPVQIEAGIRLGEYSAISLIGVGNWNFREPYAGAHLAYIRRLSK
jgi:hypothetical protein